MATTRNTVIFGGSSGVGFAVADAVLKEGSRVYLSSANQDRLDFALGQLRKLYPDSSIGGSKADLSSSATAEAALENVLKEAVNHFQGPIDHIVYTSGDHLSFAPLAEITGANALESLNVRYVGPLLLSKLLAKHPGQYVHQRSDSSITMTSTAVAHRPRPGFGAIMGCAGAVEALTRALAVDLAPIRVNVVSPSTVETGLMDRIPEEVSEDFRNKTLTKKHGSLNSVAQGYLYSIKSDMVTGQTLIMDSGFLLTW